MKTSALIRGKRGRPVRAAAKQAATLPAQKSRRGERGVALLLVLIGLAVLGLVAQETRYNSIVELRLATNSRDEMRAHFLAKSGIGLARIMMRFQKQMDSIQLPNLGGLLQQFTGGLGGAAGAKPGAPGALGGAAPPQPSTMSIQLWRMAKIDCHMLQQMVPEENEKKGGIAPPTKSSPKFDFDTENPELAAQSKGRKFGGFEGCFDTIISDEEERINLNKLELPALQARPFLNQLVSTFGDKKYEFLFDKEDTNKVKTTPNDLIASLKDWVDEDQTGTALNFSGQGEPFAKGFADEGYNYDKYDPRYRPKNGRFDSLDELYLVHGVNDRFMAAFGEKLTVYPDFNRGLNINTDDPMLLEAAIKMLSDPLRPDPRLSDPLFIDTVIQKIRAARVFALFGMSVADFTNIVAASGVAVNTSVGNNPVQGMLSDKSQTYRLKVTGTAGDVNRTITVVMRLDDGLGRLVYWREE